MSLKQAQMLFWLVSVALNILHVRQKRSEMTLADKLKRSHGSMAKMKANQDSNHQS